LSGHREKMRSKKTILFLAGVSLGVGGSLIYKKRRSSVKETRRTLEKRESLVYLALERLAKTSGGRVSASEAFFFIWVVERVCKRHNIDFPSLNFKVKQGMLISANLIYILRKLIKEESLKLEGDYLIPVKPPIKGLPEAARDLRRKIAGVIEETAAQWSMDIPNEQLVRFAQLFK